MLSQLIKDAISNSTGETAEKEKYMSYYLGEHREILNKKVDNENKPNNQLIFNFPELMVETNHSYLYGKPLTYSNTLKEDHQDFKLTQEFHDELDKIFFDNDEEFVTGSELKSSSIMGEAVELHFIDKNNNIRFIETPSTEWIFIGDEASEIHLAIRHFKKISYIPSGDKYEKKEVTKAEVYTSEMIYFFEEDGDEFKKVDEKIHKNGEIPAINYKNKGTITSKGQSDLKGIIRLVDSYNKAMSSMLDSLEYHGDPYLLLKNFGFDIEQIKSMIEAKILALNGDKDTDAKFLQWDQNVDAYEKFLDRVERMLFVLSYTPDLFSKEGMSSGDSGVALKMKYAGADLKANSRETSFKMGLKKRLRLIARQLEAKTRKPFYSKGIYRYIDIQFNRSIPQNLKELVEIVVGLAGSVSEETRINLLPFVDDLEKEIEAIENERGLSIDLNKDFGDE